MNNKATRPIILLAVFIGALITFSMIMNQEETDQTTTMEMASLPVVHFVYNNMQMNELHGYAQEMDMLSMRDGLMPVNENRQIDMIIETYGNEIDNISYKIRSMDSERLLVEVENADKKPGLEQVKCVIKLPSLFENNVEYNMEIALKIKDKTIYYYTRIMDAPESNIDECLAFAQEFHGYTFREDAETFIPTYMDAATGDTTTLNYVDLSCTLRQITWANFEGIKFTEPIISLKEVNPTYNVITFDYVMTNVTEEGEIEYYNVEEYYRLRQTSNRMYVLNFERTMNQLFRSDNQIFNGNQQLLLGIRDKEVEYLASDSGGCIAFVQEGELWSFDSVNNRISQVFSFRSPEGINSRENWNQHDIKIVRVDEAGSISFIVYGYMNSGSHEGNVGIGVYHYDALNHTVEEEVFIQSDKSYQVLKAELGDLMYVNEQKQFYLSLNHTIYKIDLNTFETAVLVENGTDNCFAASASGRYFAWISPEKENSSEAITLEDLKTGITYHVTAGTNTYLRPITFIGEDFVYGVARKTDVKADAFGEEVFPMCAIQILNTSEDKQDVIKTYRPEKDLIGSTWVEKNNVHINLVREENNRFVDSGKDTIMNRENTPSNGVSIAKAVTDLKQTQVTLTTSVIDLSETLEVIMPQHIILEEERTIVLGESKGENYYVYVKGEVLLATKDVSEAVRTANENMGVVVDENLKYVFKRARNTHQTALKNLAPNVADAGTSSISKCISIMLNREGVGVAVNELIAAGQTPAAILQSTLKDYRVIELKGAKVDELLYFLDQGLPVFAKTGTNQAILLTGYSPSYIYYYDSTSGQTKSIDYSSAETLFKNGNEYFITYVK